MIDMTCHVLSTSWVLHLFVLFYPDKAEVKHADTILFLNQLHWNSIPIETNTNQT